MEEKNTAIVVLGLVVVISIVGLVILFNTAQTGKSIASAGHNSMVPYPGGVVNAPAAKYIVTESPGAVIAGDETWRQKNTASVKYGETRQSCSALTYVGTVQSGYSEDATYSQAANRDCVYVEGSPLGFCCRK